MLDNVEEYSNRIPNIVEIGWHLVKLGTAADEAVVDLLDNVGKALGNDGGLDLRKPLREDWNAYHGLVDL
jgi:hypothetical protein